MPFLDILRSANLFRYAAAAPEASAPTPEPIETLPRSIKKSKSSPFLRQRRRIWSWKAPPPPVPPLQPGQRLASPVPAPRTPDSSKGAAEDHPCQESFNAVDSGYGSRDPSPSRLHLRPHTCPSHPRFSWENTALQWSCGQIAQHARRESALWAQALANPSRQDILDHSTTPTCVAQAVRGHTLRNAMSSNDLQSRRHQRRPSRTVSNNPALQLREPGTPLHASFADTPSAPEASQAAASSSPRRNEASQAPSDGGSGDSGGSGSTSSLGTGSMNLSGLFSNVHRTTGRRPPGLTGASSTVVGDKLYIFGGLVISQRRMSRTLYELDLLRRHWTKLDTNGDIPLPRYFHTICALGDTKLVLFGGTTGTHAGSTAAHHSPKPLSDLYMYDIKEKTWTDLKVRNPPTPRYAHCATVLPSSAAFASASAPLSALHHNPSSTEPNQGTLGVEIDGTGGAEMVVLGGQCSDDQYCHEVDVFNFRSLRWISSNSINLNKFGAYRSVVATVSNMTVSSIGGARTSNADSSRAAAAEEEASEDDLSQSSSPAILYNNYNFMNPRVEVRLRKRDGTIVELPSRGQYRPPGLRFPAAGIMGQHLVVSGSFLRSSAQEYMLWALDLRTLVWHRVDIPNGSLNQGSWNRGIDWAKRNAYVVLGDRRRSLNLDYASRRTNFSHICVIEMEALGLHDNPNKKHEAWTQKFSTTEKAPLATDVMGLVAMGLREVADMDIVVIDGERIPVNSYLLSQRWGSYFQQLMCEDLGNKLRNDSMSDTSTLQQSQAGQYSRNRASNITITPRSRTSVLSQGSVPVWLDGQSKAASSSSGSTSGVASASKPIMRSRLLFLPHTYLTARALIHYLYTLSLPPPPDPLCTPQILCSLLQIARPYRVPGLLEATVERLFQVLDGRHAAAIFNACAMAAGGGNAVRMATGMASFDAGYSMSDRPRAISAAQGRRVDELKHGVINEDSDDGTLTTSDSTSSLSDSGIDPADKEIWMGDWSAVVGLQKRALRGLMEAKREREQARRDEATEGINGIPQGRKSG